MYRHQSHVLGVKLASKPKHCIVPDHLNWLDDVFLTCLHYFTQQTTFLTCVAPGVAPEDAPGVESLSQSPDPENGNVAEAEAPEKEDGLATNPSLSGSPTCFQPTLNPLLGEETGKTQNPLAASQNRPLMLAKQKPVLGWSTNGPLISPRGTPGKAETQPLNDATQVIHQRCNFERITSGYRQSYIKLFLVASFGDFS